MYSSRHVSVADPTDALRARAARQGDLESLGGLLEKYRPQLHAAAVGVLGFTPDAEDAVHDTFVVALTRLHALRDPSAVGGWLHAILRNRCLMELRRRRPQAGPDETERRLRDLPDDSQVERQIENRELRAWVWRALASLPEQQRLTVLLRYFGSYRSYDEVAVILGVPVGTVRSRLSDAKAKLADLLLDSAGGDDGETARVTADRDAFFRGKFRELYAEGREAFLRHFSPDLRLVVPGGRVLVGRHHLAAEVDADCAAGVVLRPRRVMASGDLTVLEGVFENPPDDPFHCPPGIVLAMLQKGDRVTRLHLHLSPRPPQPAAET